MDISTMDRAQLTLAGSGLSVMLTMHFTFQLLSQHMFYWKNPNQQKPISILIFLPTVYAITSFIGLAKTRDSRSSSRPVFVLLGCFVKECYEAFAVAKFLDLMFSYLGMSVSGNVVPDEIKGREIRHLFPVTVFQRRKTYLDHETLSLLKYWTWQFVVVRPVCSILMISLQMVGMYPGWLGWVFTIVLSLSFSLAMYALVVFYRVFAKELEPHKPLAKFICIKGIVFFCFWQGVVVDILVAVGVVRSCHFWLETEHIEEAIQNVLVSVEMIIFSVLQQYAYHVSPYSGDMEKLRLRRNDE